MRINAPPPPNCNQPKLSNQGDLIMKLTSTLAISALALAISGAVYAQPANPGAGSGLPPNSPEAPMPGQATPSNGVYVAPYAQTNVSASYGQSTNARVYGAASGNVDVGGTGTGSGRP
jgi:hypothetical protein